MVLAGPSSLPVKRKRVTRACDKCHDLGIRCSTGPSPNVCQPCASQALGCTYDRPVRRRGPVPQRGRHGPSTGPSPVRSSATPSAAAPMTLVFDSSTPLDNSALSNDDTILSLVQAFHAIAYPILIYFHWPTFWCDIRTKRYSYDRHFHALTMAVCATASARLRDGAQLPPSSPKVHHDTIPSSEAFYRASLNCMGRDSDVDFDLMRTEAVLGMLCLQDNDLRGSHRHMHRYLSMSAEIGFHNESRWPSDLTAIQIEERRRLFWHQYHLDVQLAVTFGSSVRHREDQCIVAYPAEVFDDEDILSDGVRLRPERGTSLFKGWNFVTDLYRIIEHLIDRTRVQPRSQGDTLARIGMHRPSTTDGPNASEILHEVARVYHELPVELKDPHEMIGDPQQDRYGFQAANIVITMTTVKMILAGSETSSIQQRCTVAGELLDGLATIPEGYIRSASTAMLHHLAGVAHLLASAIKSPLSPWAFLQARSVLLAMADLLAIFETSLSSDAKMSSKIRNHVQRIDEHTQQAKGLGARMVTVVGTQVPPLDPVESSDIPISTAQDHLDLSSILNIPGPSFTHQQTSTDLLAQTSSPSLLPDTLLGEWPFALFSSDAFESFRPPTGPNSRATSQPPNQMSQGSQALDPSMSSFDLLFGGSFQGGV